MLTPLATTGIVMASIPSPTTSYLALGPLKIHFYALFILAGIFLGIYISERRWQARGGLPEQIVNICYWAVPFGILGGRLYNIISTPQPYFGEGGDPWQAFAIWKGGLGIWGAVALGALGAYIGARRQGLNLADVLDTMVPGLILAQAIGRLGNYFNQELYGGPMTGPLSLDINCQTNGVQIADCVPGTYQPTFLWELVWNLVGCVVLLWLYRTFKLANGRLFWAYVMFYTLGRGVIETFRTDFAVHIMGLRVNIYTSIIMFLVALGFFVWLTIKKQPLCAVGPGKLTDDVDRAWGEVDAKPAAKETPAAS